MAQTYVAFDTRSGQIVSVHHGAADAKEARASAQHYGRHAGKINEEHIAVIAVPPGAADKEKLYKVDVGRNTLVTTTAQDGGVGFSFGEA